MAKPDSRARTPASPPRPFLWLLLLPFVWQVGCIPLVNDVAMTPFGLPFPMFWQMAGVVLSSVVFAVVFHLDNRAGLEQEENAFIELTTAKGSHA
ncbi:hypothetical protein BH11PSE9_BH11PSE9_07330 [soil metagenome]